MSLVAFFRALIRGLCGLRDKTKTGMPQIGAMEEDDVLLYADALNMRFGTNDGEPCMRFEHLNADGGIISCMLLTPADAVRVGMQCKLWLINLEHNFEIPNTLH